MQKSLYGIDGVNDLGTGNSGNQFVIIFFLICQLVNVAEDKTLLFVARADDAET